MVSSLWIVRLSRWNTNTLLKWLGQPDGEGRCYRPGRQAGAAAEHRATRQLKTAGYAFQTANRKLWNSHLPFPTFLRVSYETITNKCPRFQNALPILHTVLPTHYRRFGFHPLSESDTVSFLMSVQHIDVWLERPPLTLLN